MWEWITENKVFSGFAGAFLAALITLLTTYLTNRNKKEKENPSQSIKSGKNSNNIQGGKDVNVTIGDNNVQK